MAGTTFRLSCGGSNPRSRSLRILGFSDSEMDIRASIKEPLLLKPGEIRLIPTGLVVSVPPGYEAQIRPRSGLALQHGIGMVNSPGTIDSDYRGEIGVVLINWGGTIHRQKRRSDRPDDHIQGLSS